MVRPGRGRRQAHSHEPCARASALRGALMPSLMPSWAPCLPPSCPMPCAAAIHKPIVTFLEEDPELM